MVDDVERLKGSEIVARYVGGSHFDPSTKQMNGSAFERNPKDKDGVSFTRRGLLNSDDTQDKDYIRKITASRLKVGKTAVFADLQVDSALLALEEYSQDIYFCNDPLDEDGSELANPAHALLIGFPFKGEQIGSLKSEVAGDKLRDCVIDIFPAILAESA